MSYNAQKAKEEEALPTDEIFTAIIIDLKDGIVKDLVKTDKWPGDPEGKAIEITMEVKHKEATYNFRQLFTYREEEGTTLFSPRSNMGKYKKKYDKLPEVGDQVKCMTNTEGFLKLKLE